LAIARLEAGAGAEAQECVDLAAIARDVAELYGPVAEEAGLALLVNAHEPAPIQANRQLVSQAIANLVDNAIKYSGSGASADRSILLTVARNAAEAVVTVADRGPGIPADQRGRVLKRFVRLEASRSLPGSGLGLSLVAAVARMHGGAVRLEDNAPGLKVVLTFPLAKPSQGAGFREASGVRA
jgi:signal transduction histidine kinase